MSSVREFRSCYYSISDALVCLESTDLNLPKKESNEIQNDIAQFEAGIQEMKGILEKLGKIYEKRRGQWD